MMGQHKYNPNCQLAKEGKLPEQPVRLGKRDVTVLVMETIKDRIGGLFMPDLGRIRYETAMAPEQLKLLRSKTADLRELVWSLDVPQPASPEYVEFHAKMQKILEFIDKEMQI